MYQNGNEMIAVDGHERHSTNNRMEMQAVLEAMNWIKANLPVMASVEIISDNQYVIDGLNKWRFVWRTKNWTRGKNLIKNVDLRQNLDRTADDLLVTFKWCKGHNGNLGNERADQLAVKARRKVSP